jgi:glycosyltransferase involved in cell wall biosynthesis
MRVSVVVPAFNRAAMVVEAVASVRAQTRAAAEIIVVDDGSTDDTAARMTALPVTLIRQANQGVAAARNAGIAAATGDVIAFLDADDVWHPEKLERQLPILERDPSVVLCGTGCFDWPGPMLMLGGTCDVVKVDPDRVAVRNCFVTSTLIVRKPALDAAGPFDTRLQGPEDYDLWLRVLRHGGAAILPEPLTGYRDAAGSLSKDATRMDHGLRLILEKQEAAGAFTGKPDLRRRAWAYYHYITAYMHHRAGHRSPARRHAWRSLMTHLGPFDRDDVRYRFGRLRLLVATLRGAS